MYIDPSSGGLLFQVFLILFGMISGAVLIFSSKIKLGISKLRRSFRERNGKKGTAQPETNLEEE
jgi:hypothetical protein